MLTHIGDLVPHLSASVNRYYNEQIVRYCNELQRIGRFDHYRMRNQTNLDKMWDDAAVGKKAECLAVDVLIRSFGWDDRIEPDFEVRSSQGWDHDLGYGYGPCHVKSCRRRDEVSWIFQREDTGIQDDADGHVVLVVLESWRSDRGTIKAVLPTKLVVELLREPRMDHLVGIKKALYWSDVETLR